MGVRILQGDVRAMLATLEPESVQCVVTSPPYFRLRDYGTDGQIGMEATPAEFVATLVDVFEGVRRVLRPDGVLFVNLGDSYSGSGKGPSANLNAPNGGANPHSMGIASGATYGVRPKSLFLIPQRFAIAMQDAGWIVRQEIVWAKRAPMPESVRDRCTSAWEPIYMFTKQGRYFWDQDAVRVPLSDASVARLAQPYAQAASGYRAVNGAPDGDRSHLLDRGANLRNVWDLSPEPSRENHYAAFPTEIPRRCILAATSEKGACADCGAPWARVVERRDVPSPGKMGAGHANGLASSADLWPSGTPPQSGLRRDIWQRSESVGWRPTCTHDAPVVPCVVLDPFLGSGTTALVADQLGRNAKGIELSPVYARMAEERIRRDSPMFADVEVAV